MLEDYIEGFVVVLSAIGIAVLVSVITLGLILKHDENTETKDFETTTAKPIYQQPIGDEAEPDILIIYEAEVDGVKVYPSVVKESE